MLHFNFTPFPEIETARLKLRRHRVEDAEQIFFLRTNKEVMFYLDRDPSKSVDEVVGLVNTMNKDVDENRGIAWAICEKNTDTLIGTIGFWRIKPENHRAEIGYLLHPGFWNRGYVTEALHTLIQFGFEVMNLHSIEADVNPENAASIKVLEKQGFIREAFFRENVHYDGRFLDSAVFGLLRSDFKLLLAEKTS